MVELFSKEDVQPQLAVSRSIQKIADAIDLIIPKLRLGGRLFYIGAGTSGRLAVLDSVECPPAFCTNPELVQALIAGGINSMIKSSEKFILMRGLFFLIKVKIIVHY